jgi:hypothetical protein
VFAGADAHAASICASVELAPFVVTVAQADVTH